MKYLRYLRAKKGEKRGGEAEHEKPESEGIYGIILMYTRT